MLNSRILSHALSLRVQTALACLNELWRKPLNTLLTVSVIGIALAIPAVFWVFLSNVKAISGGWEQVNQITLFLQKSLNEAEQQQLLDSLRRREDIAYANLITPAQGLARLEQSGGLNDLDELLPDNPLPPVLEIHPTLLTKTPEKMRLLFNRLKAMPEVEDAKLDAQWLLKWHAIERVASKLTQGFMFLLAVAVLLVISNTIRLAVQNRRQEIEVLKLIGATNGFICRPFVYSGVLYGLVGALVALLTLDLALFFVSKPVIKLSHAYHSNYRLMGLKPANTLLLLFFGSVLGWFGARVSVRRQIAAIEPK